MNRDKTLSFRELERLMKAVPGFWKYQEQEPKSCEACFFYCPDFRYRSCRFASCIYGKSRNVFRKEPLKTEHYQKQDESEGR